MMKQLLKKCTLVLLVLVVVVSAEAKKFDFYGFADARILGRWFDGNNQSLLWTTGPEGAQFRLEHVNIYGDWKPHSKVRFLTEIGFHWQPHGFMTNGGNSLLINDTSGSQNSTVNITPDGPTEMASVSIQRAWMDLLINQHINLRVGKFLTPVGIWNVDHGSPVLLTVRQPYMVGMNPIFPRWQYGLMAHGTAFLGDADFTYNVFLSRCQTDSTDVMFRSIKDVTVGVNTKFKLPILSKFEIGFTGYTGMNRDYGISNVLKGFPPVVNNFNFDMVYRSNSREKAFATDLKIEPVRNLLLQSELQYKKMENQLENAPEENESSLFGVYGLLGYRFRVNKEFNLTPYYMYENTYAEDPQRNPTAPTYRGGLVSGIQTLLGGVNFNFFTNYTFKLEYARLILEPGDGVKPLLVEEEHLNLHVINAQVAVAF